MALRIQIAKFTCSPNFPAIRYFFEFFPWVLLISDCANMWVQFKGGNKRRAGTIINHNSTLMCTAPADFARTNVKSALHHDKST